MIYLDYAATTPVNQDVLKSFDQTCVDFIGNPNSLHKLGIASKNLMEKATEQIAALLQVKPTEIIYTSGSSESNNLAIKGIASMYANRGKHIITTELEHSSVIAPLQYLANHGYEIDFAPLTEEGTVDIEKLKSMLREDTILVTIASVSSELGIRQPIEEIGALLKQYPKCFFHVDMTQSMGKIPITLDDVDLVSFSAHKFYGLKGIGCLIKKENIKVEPLIHGGKSTTIYRSGTPALPLLVSLAKALRLAMEKQDEKQKIIAQHSQYIKEQLATYDKVMINSTEKSIPNIINFSVIGVKPETFQHALEEFDIYISTQTACASGNSVSGAVMAVTHSKERAQSSLRVSLSHLTTEKEVRIFLEKFDVCYHKLQIRG